MSFKFKPLNEVPIEVPDTQAPLKSSFSWIPVCIILTAVAVVIGWNPAKLAIRDAWARSHAREAMISMDADEMSHAITKLIEARKISPEDPEVLYAIIHYLKIVRGDRRELAYHLRLLATKRPLNAEEQLLYGRCLLELGRIDEARRVHASLPANAVNTSEALSLLASLQAAEGQTSAAALSTRQARLLDKDSAETRLQLAIENSRSSFPEYRNQSWIEFWSLCQLPPPVGIAAARAILNDARLTAEDAKRLLPIVEAHPHGDLAIRLDIVSALIRFFPNQREDLIRNELARFEAEKKGTLVEIAAWLSGLGEHSRLIALIPSNLADSSRPLYTAIVKALVSQNRWQELKQMIKKRRPPVSNTLATLWLADAESHLQPDLIESRRLITYSITAAINNDENEELELSANLAAKLQMHDLAIDAYQGLLKALPSRQNDFLKKIRNLALLNSNGPVLLDVSRQLVDLNPGNSTYADEHIYYRLLLGQDIETVEIRALKNQPKVPVEEYSTDRHIPNSLLAALAAFRFQDKNAIKHHMAKLPISNSMSAGQRAVLCGLLASAGKTAAAFQIAEKVPEALLLDEELAFLKLAR